MTAGPESAVTCLGDLEQVTSLIFSGPQFLHLLNKTVTKTPSVQPSWKVFPVQMSLFSR